MNETELINKVRAWIQEEGGASWRMETTSVTGCPDVMFVYEGRYAWIEFKSPTRKGRISKRQEMMIKEFHKHKMHAAVCWSFRGAVNFLISRLRMGASKRTPEIGAGEELRSRVTADVSESFPASALREKLGDDLVKDVVVDPTVTGQLVTKE